jgi:hypothetical protein
MLIQKVHITIHDQLLSFMRLYDRSLEMEMRKFDSKKRELLLLLLVLVLVF